VRREACSVNRCSRRPSARERVARPPPQVNWPIADSNYLRAAAFCLAFFCLRGRRDLFFGASFAFFTDFVDGLTSAGEASPPDAAAADSCLSATSFCFAK